MPKEVFFLLIALVGGAFIYSGSKKAAVPPVQTLEMTDRSVTVLTRKHQFEFVLGGKTQKSFVSTGSVTKAAKEMGAEKVVLYFNQASISKLGQEIGKNFKKCPARFFNAHSKHIGFIPRNEEVKEKIRRINRNRTYGDIDGWQNINVKGQCATAIKFKDAGEEDYYPDPMSQSGKCDWFVVDSLEVTPWKGFRGGG